MVGGEKRRGYKREVEGEVDLAPFRGFRRPLWREKFMSCSLKCSWIPFPAFTSGEILGSESGESEADVSFREKIPLPRGKKKKRKKKGEESIDCRGGGGRGSPLSQIT